VSSVSLVIRTSFDHTAAADAVVHELHRMDNSPPVYDVRPVADLVSESIAPRRFNTLLMILLAVLALVLAAVGVYGVISYLVGERLHEIGIRISLGARPAETLLLVVRQGMKYALTGIAIGLAAALLLTKAMTGLPFGVRPVDGWTFSTVALVTAVVGLLGLSSSGLPRLRRRSCHRSAITMTVNDGGTASAAFKSRAALQLITSRSASTRRSALLPEAAENDGARSSRYYHQDRIHDSLELDEAA
jgi:predicted lysophospholipase L1 biosynthesis ABC-type transport system permease subunit